MSHETALALTSPVQLVSHLPGTRAECSVMKPLGDGVRDVNFICHGPNPGEMRRWYDTYDGLADDQPDWYALHFPHIAEINTIFFMHGPLPIEGGWWKSLAVQYIDQRGNWHDIPQFSITPPYDFRDGRYDRKPFEVYQIRFTPVRTAAVRIIGEPGGHLHLTTLAYLAAGMTTAEQAAQHLAHLRMPLPRIFQLLAPNQLWDLISSLHEVTGIAFDVQSKEGLGLDHFLDEERCKQFHEQQRIHHDPTSLYQILGSHEGWDRFGAEMLAVRTTAISSQQPQLALHHGGMLWICIPIVVNDTVLGTLENRNLIGLNQLDLEWHQTTCQRFSLSWASYSQALEQVPVYTQEQIWRIIRLVQTIVELSQQQIYQTLQVSQLRSTVEELATPVVPVWQRVLAVPLIGRIDEQRAQQLNSTVLRHVSESRASTVVFDVTGVQMLDYGVALHLSRLIQAIKLLGARSVISGIRPEVADALVSIGADLQNVATYPTLEVALTHIIQHEVAINYRFARSGEPLVAWPASGAPASARARP